MLCEARRVEVGVLGIGNRGRLTVAEHKVSAFEVDGLPYQGIAQALGISHWTVHEVAGRTRLPYPYSAIPRSRQNSSSRRAICVFDVSCRRVVRRTSSDPRRYVIRTAALGTVSRSTTYVDHGTPCKSTAAPVTAAACLRPLRVELACVDANLQPSPPLGRDRRGALEAARALVHDAEGRVRQLHVGVQLDDARLDRAQPRIQPLELRVETIELRFAAFETLVGVRAESDERFLDLPQDVDREVRGLQEAILARGIRRARARARRRGHARVRAREGSRSSPSRRRAPSAVGGEAALEGPPRPWIAGPRCQRAQFIYIRAPGATDAARPAHELVSTKHPRCRSHLASRPAPSRPKANAGSGLPP